MSNSASDQPNYTGPTDLNDIQFSGAILEIELAGEYAAILIWEDRPPHQYACEIQYRPTGAVLYYAHHADWDEGAADMRRELKRYGG